MSEFEHHRQEIEAARAEVDKISSQLEGLKNKRTNDAARLEVAKANAAAAEEEQKTNLKLYVIDKVAESAVSASVVKIAEQELITRSLNDILKSIDSTIVELEEEKKNAERRLAKATASAWRTINAKELEKATPILAKLYLLHTFDRKAQHGSVAFVSDASFVEAIKSTGVLKPASDTTATEYFTATIGTEPLERFWKVY